MRRVLALILVLVALLIIALDAAGARQGNRQLWGAIAYNTKTGAYGFVVDRKTKRDAELEAFRNCGTNCDFIRSFRDACGAIATKPKRVSSDTGASREIAQMKALKKCGDLCTIKVWACTSEK